MKTDNGESRSIWMESPDARVEPPLARDVDQGDLYLIQNYR